MAQIAKKTTISPQKVTEVKPVITELTVRYSHPNLKVSPRKLRLLVNGLKEFSPSELLLKLQFINTNAARHFKIILKNAVADAKSNHHLNADTLKISEIRVDEGLKIKRMDKSHGSRFARGIRLKRHSRLLIVLSGTIQS